MTATMNIPLHHDGGAAREVRKVDVMLRIHEQIEGKVHWFAVHESPFGGVPVLAHYRSGIKVTELAPSVSLAKGKHDYRDMAKRAIRVMLATHGGDVVAAKLDAFDRLN